MPKSGSTLAFELTRTMLEMAGVPQLRIAEEVTDASNFVQTLNRPALMKLKRAAVDGPVVIKTHSQLFPPVANGLRRGTLIGHAVCRDPRDLALSMLDAARDGRAWGAGPDGKFRTVADTVKRLHTCVRIFQKWAATPHVIPIHYERLAFDTPAVAAEIAAQLGISVDIPRAIQTATHSKFTQLNRGIPQRWKTEMDPVDARRLEVEFQDFIGTYCQEIPPTPTPRKPASRFSFPRWFARNSQKSK